MLNLVSDYAWEYAAAYPLNAFDCMKFAGKYSHRRVDEISVENPGAFDNGPVHVAKSEEDGCNVRICAVGVNFHPHSI